MAKTWLGLSIFVGLVFMLATPTWDDFWVGAAAYERGDYDIAMKRWRPLAEQGHAYAQSYLGSMYASGQGTPTDYGEAARWYRLAAEQGNAAAQFGLGQMYVVGDGVPEDYVLAYMWLNLGAAKIWKKAVKVRDTLEVLMTPAQLAEAQRLAREWKAKEKRPFQMSDWIDFIVPVAIILGLIFFLRSKSKSKEPEPPNVSTDLKDHLGTAIEDTYRLVSAYGAILENHAGDHYHPDDILPASKQTIKGALLLVVAAEKLSGKLTETALPHHRNAYSLLATFIPRDEAEKFQQYWSLLREMGDKQAKGEFSTPEKIEPLARKIAEFDYPKERATEITLELGRLREEFDVQLEITVKGLRKK